MITLTECHWQGFLYSAFCAIKCTKKLKFCIFSQLFQNFHTLSYRQRSPHCIFCHKEYLCLLYHWVFSEKHHYFWDFHWIVWKDRFVTKSCPVHDHILKHYKGWYISTSVKVKFIFVIRLNWITSKVNFNTKATPF